MSVHTFLEQSYCTFVVSISISYYSQPWLKPLGTVQQQISLSVSFTRTYRASPGPAWFPIIQWPAAVRSLLSPVNGSVVVLNLVPWTSLAPVGYDNMADICTVPVPNQQSKYYQLECAMSRDWLQ